MNHPIRYATFYGESTGYKTPVHLIECLGSEGTLPLDARRRISTAPRTVKNWLKYGRAVHPNRKYFTITDRGRVVFSNLDTWTPPQGGKDVI